MKALRNLLNTILNVLAGLSLTVMVVLTTYQVITRYVFNAPSTWSEELVGYLFAWSTMFGAAIVSGERGHMNIPILVLGGFQVSSLAMGQMTSSLGVAIGTFYWVMPVCGVVMTLFAVLNIIGIANGEICLDAADEASEAIAKVEAEAAAEKEA